MSRRAKMAADHVCVYVCLAMLRACSYVCMCHCQTCHGRLDAQNHTEISSTNHSTLEQHNGADIQMQHTDRQRQI